MTHSLWSFLKMKDSCQNDFHERVKINVITSFVIVYNNWSPPDFKISMLNFDLLLIFVINTCEVSLDMVYYQMVLSHTHLDSDKWSLTKLRS